MGAALEVGIVAVIQQIVVIVFIPMVAGYFTQQALVKDYDGTAKVGTLHIENNQDIAFRAREKITSHFQRPFIQFSGVPKTRHMPDIP